MLEALFRAGVLENETLKLSHNVIPRRHKLYLSERQLDNLVQSDATFPSVERVDLVPVSCLTN